MIRHALLALAFVFALAPLPGAPQEEKKAPPKTAQDGLKEKTEKHKKDVVGLRGLEFKREVTVGMYSKAELLDFLKAEFEKELPREKAERYQRGYAKFGLIPDDLDIYEAYMELFGSSIAGFYHPKTKELRLIKAGDDDDVQAQLLKKAGIDLEAITLVHELTHAAQDQNFELSTLPLEDETNDDLIMAIKSVIEGDASAVGWKYGFQEKFNFMIGIINKGYKDGELPGKAGQLPAYLRLTLTFPYGHGTEFVIKYLKSTEGEFKDSSKLFKDWPLSSEQILHPAKYHGEKRDNPVLVTLPDLSLTFGNPWTVSFQNVHGEFATGILLRELRPDGVSLKEWGATARAAQEGWGGDRYVVLEDGKKNAMYVWYSTWDTEEDAQQFYDGYARSLEKKYARESPAERGTRTSFKTKSGQVLIERRASDVLVFDGATDDMLKKADAVWKGAKKAEMSSFERVRKFVCKKDDVKEAFSGKCPKCGAELAFEEEKKPEPKKRKDY